MSIFSKYWHTQGGQVESGEEEKRKGFIYTVLYGLELSVDQAALKFTVMCLFLPPQSWD